MAKPTSGLRVAIAFALVASVSASASGQDNQAIAAKGEIVPELGKSVMYVFQARNNDYWFGSDDRGVYRYDGKAIVNFTTNDGLVSNRIRGIQEDKSGNVYFTTYEGISRFDGQVFTKLSVPTGPTAAWKKEPDDLWFVAGPDTGSVYRYDGKSLHQLKLPKTKIGEDKIAALPRSKFPNVRHLPYDVYTIVNDRGGNLWFGTASAGVCRFDGQSFRWLYETHLTDIEKSGGSFGIRSILEDKAGALWICNTRYRYQIDPKNAPDPGKDLIRYKREDGIEQAKDLDGTDRVYFMSIVEDQKGVLWMASYASGVWRYDGDKVTRIPVKDGEKEIKLFMIYKDKRGDLWLGTHKAGAYKFNGKTFEKFRP